MMGRKKFVGALVVGAMGAAPAMADVYSDNIVQQLEQQGFKSISTERTWLGRTRIVAEGDDGQREIIVNPNTGEILRDLMLTANGGGENNGGLVKSAAGDDRENDDGDNGGDSGDSGSGGSGGSGSGGGDSGDKGDRKSNTSNGGDSD